jgi:hypothetical protein
MINMTKRIYTPTRFALLALGAISLSAAMTSPASAQNASACRTSVGVIGDFAERCMVKPEGNLSTAILSSVGQVNATAQGNSNYSRDLSNSLGNPITPADQATTDEVARQDANFNANRYNFGHPDYDPSAKNGGVYTTAGKGGNGGAAGHTGVRHTLITPNRSVQTATPSPKAATPKSTTVDKATNTMTRDYPHRRYRSLRRPAPCRRDRHHQGNAGTARRAVRHPRSSALATNAQRNAHLLRSPLDTRRDCRFQNTQPTPACGQQEIADE